MATPSPSGYAVSVEVPESQGWFTWIAEPPEGAAGTVSMSLPPATGVEAKVAGPVAVDAEVGPWPVVRVVVAEQPLNMTAATRAAQTRDLYESRG